MDKLKNFLNSIEQFYQPKDASEKDGIGHEIEHIKGVIERMHIIAQTINENPSLYQETKVDYNIATTVAALHDIGNTINRDDHNHLGYGIIMGKLTPSDILKAPTKGNTLLSATEKHNILSHFKNNKVTNVENLSPNESSGVQNICKIMTKFDIGYYGSELFKKDQIEDITQTDVAKPHSGDKYIIVQNYGDDVYSQIDAKFQPEHTDNRDGNIMSLRKEFLEVATVWAQIAEHPEKEKELLSDYVKSHTEKAISAILYKATEIGNLFKDASSIESAVDIGETSEKLLPKICESEKQKQSGPLAKPVCDIVKSTLIGNKTLQQGIQEVANVFGINVNDISQNRSFEATIERCTTAETPPSQSQGQNEKSTDKDSI